MTKFRLKKGLKIGGLAAEYDDLLAETFVDVGHLDQLLAPLSPRFLIIGRTGSGKTALLEMLKRRADHVSTLDTEELSMQYLHNSSLSVIAGWGVNLDPFYRYLWRHVCILELIRMLYPNFEDVPSAIEGILPNIAKWLGKDKKQQQKLAETKEASLKYLKEYGNDYWIKTDTRIKNITTEMIERLKEDAEIAATLDAFKIKGTSAYKIGSESAEAQKVEQSIVDRVQAIVSDYQIADLNKVIGLLEQNAFKDPQKRFFLVIDDLDRNWMPDDDLYLQLIRSLLFAVKDLNRKLGVVKIVVALRENIHYRVFGQLGPHDPQREKWEDVEIRLNWTQLQLSDLLSKRLKEVYRRQYTLEGPSLEELLPPKSKHREDPAKFLFERTFLRPRDAIDFLNTALAYSESDQIARFTWSDLTKTEGRYSQKRLDSVHDEWKDSFFGLPQILHLLRGRNPLIAFSDLEDDLIVELMLDAACSECSFLRKLQEEFLSNNKKVADVKTRIFEALIIVGVLGVKKPGTHLVEYVYNEGFLLRREQIKSSVFQIHKMFWQALGINSKQAFLEPVV